MPVIAEVVILAEKKLFHARLFHLCVLAFIISFKKHFSSIVYLSSASYFTSSSLHLYSSLYLFEGRSGEATVSALVIQRGLFVLGSNLVSGTLFILCMLHLFTGLAALLRYSHNGGLDINTHFHKKSFYKKRNLRSTNFGIIFLCQTCEVVDFALITCNGFLKENKDYPTRIKIF